MKDFLTKGPRDSTITSNAQSPDEDPLGLSSNPLIPIKIGKVSNTRTQSSQISHNIQYLLKSMQTHTRVPLIFSLQNITQNCKEKVSRTHEEDETHKREATRIL